MRVCAESPYVHARERARVQSFKQRGSTVVCCAQARLAPLSEFSEMRNCPLGPPSRYIRPHIRPGPQRLNSEARRQAWCPFGTTAWKRKPGVSPVHAPAILAPSEAETLSCFHSPSGYRVATPSPHHHNSHLTFMRHCHRL